MGYNTLQDKLVKTFFIIVVGTFGIFCLFPLWMMLMASFTDENYLIREGYNIFIPKFDIIAYKLTFASSEVLSSYGITILVTASGVFLTLLLTSSIAYPLTVKTLRYRNIISLFAYITMLFGGGLVPTYILFVRYLHLYNNIWVLIIPGALSAYNMYLMMNYFRTIPESLSESAKIDGANEVYIYLKIILPLSKPILATIALFAAMGYWNEWFRVMLYIDNPHLYTLQYLLLRLQRQADFLNSELGSKAMKGGVQISVPSYTIRMATAMISIGPIVLLYPFLQKYFMKGIMIGAIKG